MGGIIGYDLSDDAAQISVTVSAGESEEVHSVPVYAGSEKFVIPVAAYVFSDRDEILFGEEAVKADPAGGQLFTGLLSGAVRGEQAVCKEKSFGYDELLALYMRKTVHLSALLTDYDDVECLVVTIPEPDSATIEVLEKACDFLTEEGKTLRICGYPECFFYYAMNQDASLTRNKIVLFDYDGSVVKSMMLYTRMDTRPHVSMVEERVFDMPEKADESFRGIARTVLDSEIVSAVYLSGEGFEGKWLTGSVGYLCERGRRVFQGRNLYTKGACYKGIDDRDGNPQLKNCRFFDSDKVKAGVGIYVCVDGQEVYRSLIDAGTNWFEASKVTEFMLGEEREIRIRVASYFSRDERISVIRTDSFPKRPDRCTRVRLEVKMKDAEDLICTAYDLGFGDIYASSGESVTAAIELP